jgi:hypothetical protein
MFVLQTAAADQGMRMLLRVEHRVRPDGIIEHRLEGPSSAGRALLNAIGGADWYRQMAAVVGGCEFGCSRVSTIAQHGAGAAREPLYTWVLAPKSWT